MAPYTEVHPMHYGREHITAGPGKFAMACRILDRDAPVKFNAKAAELNAETNANFLLCLNAVTQHVFP